MIDWGILFLRVTTGLTMLFVHGWAKIADFSEKSAQFPDPLGVGPKASMALAIFAEVFCSAALTLGVATRLALIPLLILMGVAFALVHAGAPFSQRELSMHFLIAYVTLMITGPGTLSIDGWRSKR